MKAAGHSWSRLTSENNKQAWKDRTEVLNTTDGLKTASSFDMVPLEIYHAEIEKTLLASLAMEWISFLKIIKWYMVKNGRGNMTANLGLSFKFGKERCILISQSYKAFNLHHLLKLTIFSSPLFPSYKLMNLYTGGKGRKDTVVHWFSYRRMRNVLCFGGWMMFLFIRKWMCAYFLWQSKLKEEWTECYRIYNG